MTSFCAFHWTGDWFLGLAPPVLLIVFANWQGGVRQFTTWFESAAFTVLDVVIWTVEHVLSPFQEPPIFVQRARYEQQREREQQQRREKAAAEAAERDRQRRERREKAAAEAAERERQKRERRRRRRAARRPRRPTAGRPSRSRQHLPCSWASDR